MRKHVGDGHGHAASAPDIVVGIQSGGAPIAESIAAKNRHSQHSLCVSATRPGSGTVRSLMAPLLKRPPRGVNNVLRSAESRLLRHNPEATVKSHSRYRGRDGGHDSHGKGSRAARGRRCCRFGKTFVGSAPASKHILYPHARGDCRGCRPTPDPISLPGYQPVCRHSGKISMVGRL